MSKPTSVLFHGDNLLGFEDDRGVFVALKPITEALNLEWSAQLRRVKRDPILSEGMVIMVRPTAGGPQEMACLPLDLLNGWLFTIDESRAKNVGTREKVLTYKRECYRVLFERFARPQGQGGMHLSVPVREESAHIRRQLVTEARQTFGPRAAGSLWFALGLPIVPEMREPGRQGVLDLIPTAPARA